VQVERRGVREDWPALPGIREFDEQFGMAMRAAEPVADKRRHLAGLWPGFIQALADSEHLTAAHATKIRADVAADLTARLDALEHGNPFETRAWGSEITRARPADVFDLAEVPDYVPLGQAGPPPQFGRKAALSACHLSGRPRRTHARGRAARRGPRSLVLQPG
jgi:hypothetical protein